MIVRCEEMKEIENRVFATGVKPELLMNEAGARIAREVQSFFPVPGQCLVVFGRGHNGGDALVAARLLSEAGWNVSLDQVFRTEMLAPLTRKKLEELNAAKPVPAAGSSVPGAPLIILDGLLGIGAKPGLREPLCSATARINRLRRDVSATVFAIDIPTGLDGDTGEAGPDTVIADFTLTVGFAKRGLLADGAPNFVGRLAVLPLRELTAAAKDISDGARESVATAETLSGLLPLRRFDTHKGECGRVGIIAGSRGYAGAAVMAANAAVRAGAGLVSLFVMPDIYPVIASATMPEVMTAPLDCYQDVLDRQQDVLAIGPGLGRAYADDLLPIIERFPGPMVVDADALNLLASGTNGEVLRRSAGPRLLTPHPGEMARLFPEAHSLGRRETAERFLQRFEGAPLTLLLKGARTLVAERMAVESAGESLGTLRLSFNTTGNPGMATGGMGDVLTGTCAALVGQGVALFDAARLGAWVCGRAAEMAIFNGGRSQESLSATDLLEFFGPAFHHLRHRGSIA